MSRALSILLLCCLPALGAENFRFVWATDIHVGRAGSSIDLTNNFVYFRTNLQPQVIFTTGDASDNGALTNLQGFLGLVAAAAPITVYAVPGNHDECPGVETTDPCAGTLYGDWDQIFNAPTNRHFVFVTNSLAFIGFTSSLRRELADPLNGFGEIATNEVLWIQEQLTNYADKTVVMMTHFPISGAFGQEIRGWCATAVNAAIATHGNVKLWLSGHRHGWGTSYLSADGVTHVSGPGLAYSVTSNDSTYAPEGAFEYGAVSNGVIHLEMIAGDATYTRLNTNTVEVSYTPGAAAGQNLLANASFEAGSHRGWSYAESDQYAGPAHAYTAAEHYNGLSAIKLEFNNATNGNVWISRPVTLAANSAYTFSVYLKSSAGRNATLKVENTYIGGGYADSTSATVTPTNGWARYTVTHTTTNTHTTYRVVVGCVNGSGVGQWLYVDAAQLESGTNATEFAASLPIEVGLSQSATNAGNTFAEPEAPVIPYTVWNAGSSSNVTLCYVVTNAWGSRVLSNAVAVTAITGAVTGTIDCSAVGKRGAFRLVAWLAQVAGTTDEITYSVLPATNAITDGQFGADIRSTPFYLTQARRMGLTWNRMLSVNQQGRWGVAEPTEGSFVYDDASMQANTNAGLRVLLNLIGDYSSLPSYATNGDGIVEAKLRTWLTNVVTHYATWVTNWEIGNEPDTDYDGEAGAQKYVAVLSNAFNVIKGVNAAAQVVTGGEFDTNFIDLLMTYGGSNYMDILGTHVYPADSASLQSRHRLIADKWTKPMWNTEQGGIARSAYTTIAQDEIYKVGYNPATLLAPVPGGTLIVYDLARTLMGRVSKNMYYDGRSSHSLDYPIGYSLFEWDGSLRPKAAMMAAFIKLCEAGEQGMGAVVTNATELHFFKVGSQAVAVLWATNTAYLSTNSPVTGFALYDAFGNATAHPVTLDASGYPVYAVGTTTTNALYSALTVSLTAPAEPPPTASGRVVAKGKPGVIIRAKRS